MHDFILLLNVNQENLISIFNWSYSVRNPPKFFHISFTPWRWKICTRVCCMTILTQNITITVPKFTFQLHFHHDGSSTVQCKPTKYTSVFKPPESAEHMYKLHHGWSNWKHPSWRFKSRREQKKLKCLFPCDWHLWLTNILPCLSARTLDKFCRDFWRGQTNFVSPVSPNPYYMKFSRHVYFAILQRFWLLNHFNLAFFPCQWYDCKWIYQQSQSKSPCIPTNLQGKE